MKRIKSTLAIIGIAALACLPATLILESGCTTTQQTATYKTLYSLESGVTTAYDVYSGQVVQGKVPTNDLPRVSKAYNQFQADMTLAVTLAQNNTNALAPDSLVQEGANVLNIINSLKK